MTMKKEYQQPSTYMVIIGTSMMTCASKGVTSEKGIDYGGIDNDGVKNPSARRRRRDVWDEEEDMEEDW